MGGEKFQKVEYDPPYNCTQKSILRNKFHQTHLSFGFIVSFYEKFELEANLQSMHLTNIVVKFIYVFSVIW